MRVVQYVGYTDGQGLFAAIGSLFACPEHNAEDTVGNGDCCLKILQRNTD